MSEHSQTCTCAQEIANSFSKYAQHNQEMVLYQTSLMSALIDGIYEGDVTIRQLLEHGDFCLGTFNQLDGELIAFDSNVHHLKEDGTAHVADPDQKTPFACMTFFKPTVTLDFDCPTTKEQIEDAVDRCVGSENLFCAVRIDGEFDVVRTRTAPRQEPPYAPMLEAIKHQPIFEFHQSTGVMVGFRCPEYAQGINIAGYHIHFINSERTGGGHVIDYRLKSGRLQMGIVKKLIVDIPQTESFKKAHLTPEDLDTSIRKAES